MLLLDLILTMLLKNLVWLELNLANLLCNVMFAEVYHPEWHFKRTEKLVEMDLQHHASRNFRLAECS